MSVTTTLAAGISIGSAREVFRRDKMPSQAWIGKNELSSSQCRKSAIPPECALAARSGHRPRQLGGYACAFSDLAHRP